MNELTLNIKLSAMGEGFHTPTESMKLTTEHAASSDGIPVLVSKDGTAYGPRDIVAMTSRTACQCVEIAEGEYEQISPEADRLISKFVGRKPWL